MSTNSLIAAGGIPLRFKAINVSSLGSSQPEIMELFTLVNEFYIDKILLVFDKILLETFKREYSQTIGLYRFNLSKIQKYNSLLISNSNVQSE